MTPKSAYVLLGALVAALGFPSLRIVSIGDSRRLWRITFIKQGTDPTTWRATGSLTCLNSSGHKVYRPIRRKFRVNSHDAEFYVNVTGLHPIHFSLTFWDMGETYSGDATP